MLVVFLCLLFRGEDYALLSLLSLITHQITTPDRAYFRCICKAFIIFTDVSGSSLYAVIKTKPCASFGRWLCWLGDRWHVSALCPASRQHGDVALPVRAMSGAFRNPAIRLRVILNFYNIQTI